ncbi:nuclear transport factor 2 family protein [Nakamurella deserti]|uniref:nuclear transport factor 2 family protein n=1 Tax=Nakamurella deserti TaxID=2164074 RepID=UPI000DBE21B5|nr:nuclear transport factor 2 family protein [Nakamurella deserti]
MTSHTDFVDRYLRRAAADDVDAHLALFAPDAVVHDDGHTHVGLDAIRAWRSATVPVRSDVLDVTEEGGTTARVRISGDFPGSPVVLRFRFAVDHTGRITSLTIGV